MSRIDVPPVRVGAGLQPVALALGRRGVRRLGTAFVAACLIAMACGGDDDDDAADPAPSVAPPATSRVVPASPTPELEESLDTAAVIAQVRGPFAWPAEGPLTSFMGPEHPEGIDIGLDAPGSTGSPEVRAAADGVVRFAGGSDEETLGISIVIDHGNGITTTYGHLEEVSVEEGEEVVQSQTIGIGGSTGVSTGRHLHFEVRKDGATVDPLDVLPADVAAAAPQSIDCAESAFGLAAGSQVLLNFGALLRDGERIVGARTEALNDGPALSQRVDGVGRVLVTSEVNFDGAETDDEYSLRVTLDSSDGNRVITCGLAVERRSVATVFYARANPEPEGEPEPTVEPTPTPTPVYQINVPSYEIPATSGGGSQSPSYGIPAGATPAISSPSYGVPGSQ